MKEEKFLERGGDEPIVINEEAVRAYKEKVRVASEKVQKMREFFSTNVFPADLDSGIAQVRRDLLKAMSDGDVLEMIISSDESKWKEKPNLYIDLMERFDHVVK